MSVPVLVCADVEPPGLNPRHDRIMEIALAKFDGADARMEAALIERRGFDVAERHRISTDELARAGR